MIVIGVCFVAAVAIGVTVGLVTRGSSKAKPPAPSPAAYALLYAEMIVGKTTTAILSQWPPPYQTYRSGNNGDQCYEWYDQPRTLYNLCFKNGVLAFKYA